MKDNEIKAWEVQSKFNKEVTKIQIKLSKQKYDYKK